MPDYPKGSVAQDACSDAINAALVRAFGLTNKTLVLDEEQRNAAQPIADQIKAEYAEAEIAVNALHHMTNTGNAQAFVDLLSREHAYLLDKIAWTVLKAVATRISDSGDYVDGRISTTLAEFASQNTIPLRRR